MTGRNTISDRLNKFETPPSNQARDFFHFIFDLAKTGLAVIILVVLLRSFVVQPYVVEGDSMKYSYVNNEYLLAERISLLRDDIKRGDVVVFRPPQNTSTNYIKRVIGLPGEKVKIENNTITITKTDGQKITLNETYLNNGMTTTVNSNTKNEFTVKDGEYFVMGDNRERSSDSREWGGLPKANIEGRAWLSLFPFDRFGLHGRVNYLIL